MTLFFADLVREISHGVGSGDLLLEGALPGHRRFADAVPAGQSFHYAIAGVTHPQDWETGEGQLGSGGTLLRLPLASSAGGAAVSLSPGLKIVTLTVAAAWFAAQEAGGGAVGIDDVAGLQAALDGKAALAEASFTGPLLAPNLGTSGDADIGGIYRVDGVKVVGNRRVGWSNPSGSAVRGAFDTGSVTTAQLAQRVKALIDDLVTHGLIGA